MESLAATSLATEMREHEKKSRTLKLQRVRAVDDEEREVYDESIKDVTEHLSILKNRIEAKEVLTHALSPNKQKPGARKGTFMPFTVRKDSSSCFKGDDIKAK